METGEFTSCPDCINGLAHCHDVLVEHVDGFLECINSDCSEVLEAHAFVISCADFDGCFCVSVDLRATRPPIAAA